MINEKSSLWQLVIGLIVIVLGTIMFAFGAITIYPKIINLVTAPSNIKSYLEGYTAACIAIGSLSIGIIIYIRIIVKKIRNSK